MTSAAHVRVRAGGEDYALPVEAVREVAQLGDVTPVPGAAPAVLGVRNLRGQVLPVADLRALLDLPRSEPARRLVIVEGPGGQAGFAVDELVGIAPLPPLTEPVDSPLLQGAAIVDGTLVAGLKVGALLSTIEGEGGR
jgi:purine-binding chemotaxis protein CheW